MGMTWGRAQATSTRVPPTMARLLVVIDATVGLDEPGDALGVEFLQGVDARPCRERDATLHRRIGSEDDVAVVLLHDALELGHQLGTLAAVLDHHTTVLEIVNLKLERDGLGMNAPGRDV